MDMVTYGLLNQKADIKSPHLKGSPTTTNPRVENDSKRIATTHFVHEAIKESSFGLRFYGYDVEPGKSLVLDTTQVYLLIGREAVSDKGISCFIDQWGGIVYFTKNENLATIQLQNEEIRITNLTNENINVICFPYSVYVGRRVPS